MSPQRIQRQRTKGWRMPEGAIVVSRPSKWGNPFAVGAVASRRRMGVIEQITVRDRTHAVELYREWIADPFSSFVTGFAHPRYSGLDFYDVRGRDLCCWCPLDQPCHADVLLELANGGAS